MTIHNTAGKKTAGALALCLLAGACAPANTTYRNLYDGLQKREQMVNPNSGPMASEAPTYDSYTRERDEALNKDTRRPSLP